MLASRKIFFLLYVGDVIKQKIFTDHEKKIDYRIYSPHIPLLVVKKRGKYIITMLLLITKSKVSPNIFNHHFAMTSPLISTKPVRAATHGNS